MTNDGWGSYDPLEVKYGKLDRDQLLMEWDKLKKAVEAAKLEELDMRKYIVKKAFPNANEGMNNQELGNGYQLKANVKFNYNLVDNNTVEKCLDEISKIGNQGAFIAERLVGWTPRFLLTEYRKLQEEAEISVEAKQILDKVSEMLVITDAAPTLEIKAPKDKK